MNDSKILAATAEHTLKVMRNGTVFEYENDDDRVSIGSIVSVQYEDDDEILKIYLTGASRTPPPEDVLNSLQERAGGTNDIEYATLSSPIGQAVFDKIAGEAVTFTTGNSLIHLTIAEVN